MVPRTLLAGLVDDAALFPPGNAPMARALSDHAQHLAAWYGDRIGPFLCPASRVAELLAELPEGQDLRLSIVVDDDGQAAHVALRAVATDPRVTLAAVEASAARLGDDTGTVGDDVARLPGTVGYLEVPRTGFEPVLELVGAGWHAAKYRTGGTSSDAFPSELELAAFLVAAAERDLPFKLTAGLHHAVRTTDPGTGFEQHGVLNVLVATRVAQQKEDVADVAAVLATRDAAELVEFALAWDEETCADVRGSFRSFGCCGVTDPVDELAALGLLDSSTR